MTSLAPLEILYDRSRGRRAPLPTALDRIYGPLRIPFPRGRAHVVANFAESLDGVVTLDARGPSGGGEITGRDPHDRLLLALYRALADVVVVGAGTLRAVPRHRWTAQHAFPARAHEFAELRRRSRKRPFPLTAFVTASGDLDLELPVFLDRQAPVVIVTTREGERRLRRAEPPDTVRVVAVGGGGSVPARGILRAVHQIRRSGLVLVEGGPHLLAGFLGQGALDELFLTVSPQIVGRSEPSRTLGLVAGQEFAPDHPVWGSLVSVRRGGNLLFLRYAFDPQR